MILPFIVTTLHTFHCCIQCLSWPQIPESCCVFLKHVNDNELNHQIIDATSNHLPCYKEYRVEALELSLARMLARAFSRIQQPGLHPGPGFLAYCIGSQVILCCVLTSNPWLFVARKPFLSQ